MAWVVWLVGFHGNQDGCGPGGPQDVTGAEAEFCGLKPRRSARPPLILPRVRHALSPAAELEPANRPDAPEPEPNFLLRCDGEARGRGVGGLRGL